MLVFLGCSLLSEGYSLILFIFEVDLAFLLLVTCALRSCSSQLLGVRGYLEADVRRWFGPCNRCVLRLCAAGVVFISKFLPWGVFADLLTRASLMFWFSAAARNVGAEVWSWLFHFLLPFWVGFSASFAVKFASISDWLQRVQ
ncbi:hypothetical protein U1Q18_002742 [Sarracenia purpurea var. burkii]